MGTIKICDNCKKHLTKEEKLRIGKEHYYTSSWSFYNSGLNYDFCSVKCIVEFWDEVIKC